MICYALLFCLILPTCFGLDTLWSSKLGLPPETDEDLARDFYIHKDDIGRWIQSLGDCSRAELPLFSCTLCISVVNLALSLIRNEVTPHSAEDSLTQLCTSVNIYPAEICEGTMHRFVPPASFIATERFYLTATDVCSMLIQDGSCGNANASLSNWEIFIEGNRPPVYPALHPQGHPTAQILQISDTHLDLEYIENSHANCGDPLCCRKPIPENSSTATAAGPFGEYSCDIPLGAMNNLFEDAALRYNYSFVLLTGDLVPHNIWGTSEEGNVRHFNAVANKLNEVFPHIPVYPVLGNHEPHPVNLFAPSSVWHANGGEFNLGWMYDRIATLFQRHLPSDAAASLRSRGFYTLITPQGVRLIVLNTNICYTLNLWLLYDTVDPEGQLQWFSNTLAAAEKAGEMVYVVGHVPPGDSQCWLPWAAHFNAIINRYAHCIKGQFYGHTHNDDLKIFFEKSPTQIGPAPRPTSSLFIGPSVAPYTDVNPAFKVYEVDGTWEIIDHETYYYDISLANKEGKPKLERLYTAREAYDLKSLKPEDLYDFVVRMVNDDALFQVWYKHLSRNAAAATLCEDSTCRMNILCNMVTTDYGDQSHCNRLKSMLEEP